jgi:hypothetical protein
MRRGSGNDLRNRRLQPYFASRRGLIRPWVLPPAEAFPKQVDDFDRRLEIELARLLDRVVRTPAPPRRGHPVNGPPVKLDSSARTPTATAGVSESPRVRGSARFS